MTDRSHAAIAALVEQLLEDPLVQLVMSADRIDRQEARALLRGAALKAGTGAVRAGPPQGAAATDDGQAADFRCGVGVVLFNADGRIFVGERADIPGAWQMPQGGIDAGETPQAAALRELREEIGADAVELLGESREWLTYEFPEEVVGKVWGGRWRGQRQKWFAMRFLGEDRDIDIVTDHPEFSAWRWATVAEAIGLIAPFKRRVYERLASEFSGIGGSDAAAATP